MCSWAFSKERLARNVKFFKFLFFFFCKSGYVANVTYLSLVDEADDSPLEFFGEFPAIKKHEVS